MKVSMEGIGENVATFEAVTDGTTKVTAGAPVMISGNGKVCACTKAGDIPVGVALSVRGSYCAVQIKGYMKMSCDTAVTAGYRTLASDASGKLVAVTTGGRGFYVVDVDSGVCGVIL